MGQDRSGFYTFTQSKTENTAGGWGWGRGLQAEPSTWEIEARLPQF